MKKRGQLHSLDATLPHKRFLLHSKLGNEWVTELMWTRQGRKGSPEIKMYTFNLLPVSTIPELFWLTFNQSCSLEDMESQNILHFLTGNFFCNGNKGYTWEELQLKYHILNFQNTFVFQNTPAFQNTFVFREYVRIPDVKSSVITWLTPTKCTVTRSKMIIYSTMDHI
jgi:hypothetical protein